MVKHDIVEELRRLLGSDVILLACKLGTKKPLGKWKNLGLECMDDSRHLEKLRRGNVGVLLGSRSGGLCSLDIDDDEDYSAFVRLNSNICETLRTRGARGGNIWWRLKSPNPPLTPLKLDGQAWGEWRADGAQTIIHGTHPNGGAYTFLNRVSPRSIELGEIDWPAGLTPTLTSEARVVTETTELTELPEPIERAERTECSERTDANRCGIGEGVVCPIKTRADAVAAALPTGPHQNHACLFKLARAVKALEAFQGEQMSLVQKRRIFDLWHERAGQFLKKDQKADEYWFEFLDADENAMSALGVNLADAAWEQVKRSNPPPEAKQFSDEQLQALVGLCRQMWLMCGRKPFFLSARTVQRFFGLTDHVRAARWLTGLRKSKILKITDPGSPATMKASRYAYLPNVE